MPALIFTTPDDFFLWPITKAQSLLIKSDPKGRQNHKEEIIRPLG